MLQISMYIISTLMIYVRRVPTWSDDGMTYRLLAGCMLGHTSPLPVHSELFAVDIIANEDTFLNVKNLFRGEIAILINTGTVELDGQVVEQGQLLVSDTDRECGVDLKAGTRVLLFSGPAFPEERYINWNFVSSSKERIEQAREDWKNHNFQKCLMMIPIFLCPLSIKTVNIDPYSLQNE